MPVALRSFTPRSSLRRPSVRSAVASRNLSMYSRKRYRSSAERIASRAHELYKASRTRTFVRYKYITWKVAEKARNLVINWSSTHAELTNVKDDYIIYVRLLLNKRRAKFWISKCKSHETHRVEIFVEMIKHAISYFHICIST